MENAELFDTGNGGEQVENIIYQEIVLTDPIALKGKTIDQVVAFVKQESLQHLRRLGIIKK